MAHPTTAPQRKRETDRHWLIEWIEPGARVVDLGCGRGVLLEDLQRVRQARVVGVDLDGDKALACLRRGLDIYQGEIGEFLAATPDAAFDWVVLSRTVQELQCPAEVLREAARVGRRVAVGIVNYGYWRNRLSLAWHGRRVRNEVYPRPWAEAAPLNPVSLEEFEAAARAVGLRVGRRVCLRGDWVIPCRWWPGLRAGYALYELHRAGTGEA